MLCLGLGNLDMSTLLPFSRCGIESHIDFSNSNCALCKNKSFCVNETHVLSDTNERRDSS